MYYGLYSSIRSSAWQCLIDFHINELPVNVKKIAKDAGIYIVKNSAAHVLKPNELARSFYDGETWIIVYDDTKDEAWIRFTIAHELGHFFLGHAMTQMKYGDKQTFKKKPCFEQQADMFAVRLLCPACVIHSINADSANAIAHACGVPDEIAERRYKRMCTLNKRNKFLTSSYELEVQSIFENYISSKKGASR